MQQNHDPRHRDLRDDDQQSRYRKKTSQRFFRKLLGRFRTFRFKRPGISGHEGLRECAFSEYTAKQVRKHQGGEERVCDGPRTQLGKDHHVSKEAKKAASQSPCRLGERVSQDTHLCGIPSIVPVRSCRQHLPV